MIKLKDLLKKDNKIMEDVHAEEPKVTFSIPHAAQVSQAQRAASEKTPFVSKTADISKSVSDSEVVNAAANVIKRFENSKDNPSGGYNKVSQKWFPHRSVEGGSPTIAYGHKMQPGEDFSGGISDKKAEELLKDDIRSKIQTAKRNMRNFDSFPIELKVAILNGLYRGDMGTKTMQHLAVNDFGAAAQEYLNHKEYRTTTKKGVKRRMEYNRDIIKSYS